MLCYNSQFANCKLIKTFNLITMEQIQITQQEIQEACKKQVFRNKKKYYRKLKHKTKQHG